MLTVAIVAVIVLNALFAFAQERQAERAVEALERYLPRTRRSSGTGAAARSKPASSSRATSSSAEAGDQISADARLLEGAWRSTSRR